MRAEEVPNPYIKGVYGSEIYTLEVSAMIRDIKSGEVWLERQTYQTCLLYTSPSPRDES
jgi:hypothetical protein